MSEPIVVFLLGLAGAGKSTVANWMAEDIAFIHLDIDPGGVDGIDACNLRDEWIAYGKGDPRPMAESCRERARAAGAAGVVLSFPSMVFSRGQIDAGRDAAILSLVLYGSDDRCLRAFLEREEGTGRGFDARRWHRFSDGPLKAYAGDETQTCGWFVQTRWLPVVTRGDDRQGPGAAAAMTLAGSLDLELVFDDA